MLRINDERRAVPAGERRRRRAAGLSMDTETFCVLAAGRRGCRRRHVDVEGDNDLARQVIDAMGVTP